jgi:hypothetical protein
MTVATAMPAPRTFLTATVTDTGRIFLMGGADSISGTPYADNIEFDPGAGTFTARALMPSPRWQHGAAFLNGKIYVAGGSSEPAFLMLFGQPDSTEVDVYDVATDTWTTLPSLATARHDTSLVPFGTGLWLLSGVETTNLGAVAYNETDLFDPVAGAWSSGPALGLTVSSTSAVAAGNVFVAFPSLTTLSAPLAMASSTATGFTTVPGSFPFANESRAVGLDGRVYVIGGVDPSNGNHTTTSVQSFDATVAPTLPLYQHTGLTTDRARAGVCAWNGQIFVFGGDQGQTVSGLFGPTVNYFTLASVEVYTP